MIVFTLDTLADNSHRRHLIDPSKNDGVIEWRNLESGENRLGYHYEDGVFVDWQPNYPAYYEACDGDAPIKPVTKVFSDLKHRFGEKSDVVIWSSCCESARDKLENWIYQNIQGMCQYDMENILKLRPIGDDRPQEELFKLWYDINRSTDGVPNVSMVFSSHGPTIAMFRKRGVFVFDCNQGE